MHAGAGALHLVALWSTHHCLVTHSSFNLSFLQSYGESHGTANHANYGEWIRKIPKQRGGWQTSKSCNGCRVLWSCAGGGKSEKSLKKSNINYDITWKPSNSCSARLLMALQLRAFICFWLLDTKLPSAPEIKEITQIMISVEFIILIPCSEGW